jgi:hypothetical protein
VKLSTAAALAALAAIGATGCAVTFSFRIGGSDRAVELAWSSSAIDPRIGEKHASTVSACGIRGARVAVYKDAASPEALAAACEIVPATAAACAKALTVAKGAGAAANLVEVVRCAISPDDEKPADDAGGDRVGD